LVKNLKGFRTLQVRAISLLKKLNQESPPNKQSSTTLLIPEVIVAGLFSCASWHAIIVLN
jgi:hypothetical protein